MKKYLTLPLLIVFCIRGVSALPGELNLIERMTVQKNKLTVVAHKEFSEAYLDEDFYVEYESDINLEALDKSIVIMPFITQVLSLVWASGKTYYVDSMDRRFYESLKKIKEVFYVLYPNTNWSGELVPRILVDNVMSVKHDPATHVALLYSGGLDSTTTSYYLGRKRQLLITAWGQWDLPLQNEKLWKNRKLKTKEYASQKGYECTFLKSNYVRFLRQKVLRKISPEVHHWRGETIEGIGWAGLTAPILTTKGYCSLYIASSESWNSEYPSVQTPYIDNNLFFSDARLFHHLFAFSRVDKMVWIINERKRLGLKDLEIHGCRIRDERNCCECTRCAQTMAGILIMGEQLSTYGYNVSPEKASKHIKYHMTNKAPRYEDMYIYQCLVNLAGERIAQGARLPEVISWLPKLTFNFDNPHDTDSQQKIDFKRLHEMFPHIKAESDADFILS